MSNSMSNDYFSFMSDKWERKHDKQRPPVVALRAPSLSADTIDFVEEPQIEVIESVASDTIIERIFKHFAKDSDTVDDPARSANSPKGHRGHRGHI